MISKDITLIAGPTASGKSSLALKLAKERDGVIVNADALQVYDCYQVLTARPSEEDLAIAPHLLYGHQANELGYSVGTWLEEVRSILQNDHPPLIITGGTGLYFEALLNGLCEVPDVPDNIRESNAKLFEEQGLDAMVERLKEVDPEICPRTDLKNPRRVLRALDVFDATSRPLSHWQAQTPPSLVNFEDCEAFVVMPETSETDARIATRFEKMMKTGALEEVESQMIPWRADLPANKALGARQIAQYILGEISYDEACELSYIETRRYAKRQRSWFRSHMKNWQWRLSAFSYK